MRTFPSIADSITFFARGRVEGVNPLREERVMTESRQIGYNYPQMRLPRGEVAGDELRGRA